MKTSISEIRRSWLGEKSNNDRDLPWVYHVIRPLSFYLTKLVLLMGVSANQVTIFSLFIVIIGCISLSFGYDTGVYLGAILLNLFWIFDATDGNIARVTKTYSPYGEYLDAMVGAVMGFAPHIALGIALYVNPDEKLSDILNLVFNMDIHLNSILFLYLGVIAAISWLLSRLAAYRELSIILRYCNQAKKERYIQGKSNWLKSKKWRDKLFWIYENAVLMQPGFWSPWLLIAAFTKSLSIFIAFYGIMYLLHAVLIVIWNCYYLKKMIKGDEI